MIALTLWALLSNPSQLEEVARTDRSLVKAAVEETLRWAGPVGTATRQTTEAMSSSPERRARTRRADRRGAVVGQPRPSPLDRPRPVRHPSQGRRPPRVLGRHALLPGCLVRPTPGARDPRSGARQTSGARAHRGSTGDVVGLGVPRSGLALGPGHCEVAMSHAAGPRAILLVRRPLGRSCDRASCGQRSTASTSRDTRRRSTRNVSVIAPS